MTSSQLLRPYLDDLEQRIDPAVEDALWAEWRGFIDGRFEGDIFSPIRIRPNPPSLKWPHVPVNDAIGDFELMALQQLATCSQALEAGSGALMCVRCNYGTGIMPTLFGAQLFFMDRDIDTLPTAIPLGGIESTHLEDSLKQIDAMPAAKAIKDVLARGVPHLRNGLGAKVFDMGGYYREILKDYPKITQYVHIYHPDMQGPMDICELLWGSSLFVALLEAPELVTSLLELVTDTYVAFMNAWIELVPFTDSCAVHWSMLHKGHIMIRDDSAMNLSSRMFARFIKPYDQRLLDAFGGGGIHFCGRGDHYIGLAADIHSLTTINLSQPEYNDMDVIFDHTIDRGIAIVGLPRTAAESGLAFRGTLRGRVHAW